MKIFISWSGTKSNKIAEALRNWLEQVIQSTEPWISTSIDKGRKWSQEISDRLEESKIGIICLTRENLNAPWILFEAGAISKTSDSYVCTLLTDISSPTEVSGPLSSFQATKFNKADIFKLCKTINSKIKDSKGGKSLNEKSLEDIYETFWPKLEREVTEILLEHNDEPETHIRSERELIEETLEGIRFLKEKFNDVWTNKEVREIMDHYVERYMKQKSLLNRYEIASDPHLSEFVSKMSQNPLVKKLFANESDLKKYIDDKYDLPF
ncbi:TIR domain-containing protein [Flavobacterium sp.]|uniref:TIR domain-containing protein n=1 Tax=Flavobacterium sp. TaxID=239 RepID=UPI0039E3BF6A